MSSQLLLNINIAAGSFSSLRSYQLRRFIDLATKGRYFGLLRVIKGLELVLLRIGSLSCILVVDDDDTELWVFHRLRFSFLTLINVYAAERDTRVVEVF